MAQHDFANQLRGYSLTTAEILYHMPDHPALIQSYIWQDYDVHPRLARHFNSFAREQAALLLESIDDWLARHQMRTRNAQRPIRLGMGIYVVNETVRQRGRRAR